MMLGLPKSFWANTSIEHRGYVTACLVWTGPKTSDGYAADWSTGRQIRAHRLTFNSEYGHFPMGVPDHLCRVTLCVNASHLEDVTNRENILRGTSPAAVNARKTHCKSGHEFTPENTRISSRGGERVCRTCNREANQRYYAKRAAKGGDSVDG